MPYEPTLQSPTPATPREDRTLYPTTIQQPAMLPTEIPPGVDWVTLPNGVRTLAYTQPAVSPAPIVAA